MVAPAAWQLALPILCTAHPFAVVDNMTRWIDETPRRPPADDNWTDFEDLSTVHIYSEHRALRSIPVSPYRAAEPEPVWDDRPVRDIVLEMSADWPPSFRSLAIEVLGSGFNGPATMYRAWRVRNAFALAVWQGNCHQNADGSADALRQRFSDRLTQLWFSQPAPPPGPGFVDAWLGRVDLWGAPYDPPSGWLRRHRPAADNDDRK